MILIFNVEGRTYLLDGGWLISDAGGTAWIIHGRGNSERTFHPQLPADAIANAIVARGNWDIIDLRPLQRAYASATPENETAIEKAVAEGAPQGASQNNSLGLGAPGWDAGPGEWRSTETVAGRRYAEGPMATRAAAAARAKVARLEQAARAAAENHPQDAPIMDTIREAMARQAAGEMDPVEAALVNAVADALNPPLSVEGVHQMLMALQDEETRLEDIDDDGLSHDNARCAIEGAIESVQVLRNAMIVRDDLRRRGLSE